MTGRPAVADLSAIPPAWDAGLPAGTVAAATATLQGALDGFEGLTVVPERVAQWLWLPWYLGVEAPPPPVSVRGHWMCVDLGPGDAEVWATFQATLTGAEDAHAIARAAQEWRLAVTPYSPGPIPGAPHTRTAATPVSGPLQGIRVLDLTVAWAGPLATVLLAALGAEVIKIEPLFRPDGFRFALGHADHSPWFVALNRGKRRSTLDLDQPPDRAEFADLAAGAHLVIDNLSVRARANLALHELVGGAPWLSVTAFPPGTAEHGWTSYGTGVHAMSGLAADPDGTYRAPAVAYPDVLGGLRAFVLGAALALDKRDHGRGGRAEVSMAETIADLAATSDGGRSLAARPNPPPPPADPARLAWPFAGEGLAALDAAAP